MTEIRPQLGFQETFASSPADIAIGGGAAGAGKTFISLAEPLRHMEVKGFGATIFRRYLADIKMQGGLWQEAESLYPQLGGSGNKHQWSWSFRGGSSVNFGFIDGEYKKRYQGAQICLLIFDELTHFTEDEFFYLLTRNRSKCGVRPYVRATCNPDADSWVAQFIAWWIDQATGLPIPERAGKLRYMVRRSGKIFWASTRRALMEQFRDLDPEHIKSVTFIPGDLRENKYLGRDYEGSLLAQDDVQVARLLRGNWKVRYATGTIFRREMFRFVDEVPEDTEWVRSWDLASTEVEASNSTTAYSYTAGVKIGYSPSSRRYYFGDLVFGRWDSGDVELIVRAVAGAKPLTDLPLPLRGEIHCIDGKDVKIWFCRERAGAGKAQLKYYVRVLAGWTVDGDIETGEKPVRLGPLAAQAKHGNVLIRRGPWNDTLIAQLEHAPAKPDDVGDAASAGFEQIVQESDGEDEAEQMVSEMAGGLREPAANDDYPEELEESYDRGGFSW